MQELYFWKYLWKKEKNASLLKEKYIRLARQILDIQNVALQAFIRDLKNKKQWRRKMEKGIRNFYDQCICLST